MLSRDAPGKFRITGQFQLAPSALALNYNHVGSSQNLKGTVYLDLPTCFQAHLIVILSKGLKIVNPFRLTG